MSRMVDSIRVGMSAQLGSFFSDRSIATQHGRLARSPIDRAPHPGQAAPVNKTAFITGASAGIGKAFAEQLARDGFDLVLSARRTERLNELAERLEAERGVRVQVVTADLADPSAPEQIKRTLDERGIAIDVLVNNAGFGIKTTYQKTDWQLHAQLIQVEVTAVAHLTHLFLPGMVERGYGRIIHVASLAGLMPGAPTSTLYPAAKSFLVKFAESLAAELTDTGVNVCAVCPGFTFTEFHDVMGTRRIISKLPAPMWQSADRVAREGIDAVMRGEIVYVTGPINRALAVLMQHLPLRTAQKMMRGQAKRYRAVSHETT
jgi:uncharacterized protein